MTVFESKADGNHALLSASGAHRWATCPASLRLEKALPRRSSKFADEGTAAHEVAAWSLLNKRHPSEYPHPHVEVGGEKYLVDAEMAGHVDYYRRVVLDYAKGGDLLVEQRVDFSTWIDVEDSFGTSDSVILHEDRITIVDLKYGRGVKVDADENEQLMLYALGALYEYEMLGEYTRVVMVICQPRLEHVSEYEIDVTSLKTFALNMQAAARRALDVYEAVGEPSLDKFKPSDKACRFCDAKATCPALTAMVEVESRDLFASLVPAEVEEDALARVMAKVDTIEAFCKAVRAETERRLLAGQPVAGFKLVEGRRGARKWADETAAEAALKSFRLKVEDMYDLSVISPTSAEKLLKDASPRRWAKLQPLIGRSDGKPSVAPASDKRPALVITSVTDAFAALAEAAPQGLPLAAPVSEEAA